VINSGWYTRIEDNLSFLPTTLEEMQQLGWDQLDLILVSGDTYIDTPYSGIAVIGHLLVDAGYRVGVIAQPDITSDRDITRLGEPALFWGVSGGTVDSMVANYTATLRKRQTDDFTPGGENNRRPDRAVIAYTNLIKRYFKSSRPIVLGGIEASLRRITHYDYWSDRLRAPILFDSKADYLLYGMAESSVLELAEDLREERTPTDVRGLCYLSKVVPEGYLVLPSFEEVSADQAAFTRMFHVFYQNNDPISARGLAQRKGDRYLVQNPPSPSLDQASLDKVYAFDYQRAQHPYYERQGQVKALETIRFAIPTHRGCYGECNFCAISVHEGRTVTSRSVDSILSEAQTITKHPQFKGIINDLSGPTANMYGFECEKKLKLGACEDRRCIHPKICPVLRIDHRKQIELLQSIRKLPGVRKVSVGSGIRYDMVLADTQCGMEYLNEIVRYHTSGQLKVAPEHSEQAVLSLMGKPSTETLLKFKEKFEMLSRKAGKEQYLTYYLIAAYPGSSEREMKALRKFVTTSLQVQPEQVQVFTPTPSTYSSVMYYTEQDPFTGEPLFVEKNLHRKSVQKELVTRKQSNKSTAAEFQKLTPHHAQRKNLKAKSHD
jgi:uncharacterized radical SAM protein YgiQ